MRQKMLITLLVVVASIFIYTGAFAAWTQGKGKSYNQLTYSYYHSTEKFTTINHDSEGVTIDGTSKDVHRTETEEYTTTSITYYVEYGLMDNLTVVFSAPYTMIRSNDVMANSDEDGPAGIGDINLGLRQKISDNIGGGVLMSVQADLKIPEAYEYKNPTTYTSLGDGQYDATLTMKFGRGFGWGYTVVDLGYQYRFENDQFAPATFKPSDNFKVTINAGYNINKYVSFRPGIAWSKSVGNAEVADETQQMFVPYGYKDSFGDRVLIKSTLGLEASSLSATAALAFTVTSKSQVVVTYGSDLAGIGVFKSEDAGLGETYSLAATYSF